MCFMTDEIGYVPKPKTYVIAPQSMSEVLMRVTLVGVIQPIKCELLKTTDIHNYFSLNQYLAG